MRFQLSRRAALGSCSSLIAGLAIPRLMAADVTFSKNAVQFRPEIEPLVRLLEETPRERIFEVVAAGIGDGRPYRDWLAALFLAAIRNVQPRPAVGFKFHSVLVVNSAHLASLAGKDTERWLPIFWAIDYFKRTQEEDVKEGDWTMAAVDESRLPSPERALDDLRNAMKNWDVEAADVAAASAARVAPAHVLLNLFTEFGSRDFRSIGHKSIYVANAFRMLEVIGWEHAEPIMRSLAYALLNHTGEPNPGSSDLVADRAGRDNVGRSQTLRSDWNSGKADDYATIAFIEACRQATPSEIAELTARLINEGTSVDSIYDGIYASSAELVMRQPEIVPLHSMTTTNAIHYLFTRSGDDTLRRWLLLQNASFLGHFRESATSRSKLADRKITELKLHDEPHDEEKELDVAIAALGSNREDQAGKVLGYLSRGGDPAAFIRQARQLIFLKGNDSHDYKYSSAILEDYYPRSPLWRDRILAAASYLLTGPEAPDTDLPKRVAAAFA